MLRYFIFIEYGLLPDLRVGVLISASQILLNAPNNGRTLFAPTGLSYSFRYSIICHAVIQS